MKKTIISIFALLMALMVFTGVLTSCRSGQSGEKPADDPTDKPADEPADKPTDKPADESADENEDVAEKEYRNYLQKPEIFPVSFTYGGTVYNGFGQDYTETGRTVVNKEKSELTVITLDHSDGRLRVTVEAEYYPGYNAYEWTVWFENIGSDNSQVISKVNAAEMEFTGENPVLRGINGDAGTLYSHYEKDLSKLKKVNITNTSGRPTHVTFPYYNLEYGSGGVLLSVGWAGCFGANFETNGNTTSYSAGLYDFGSYLKPGEKVRTPLMSFVFYEGRNENDTMNIWRRWFIDCNMPRESSGEAYSPNIVYHPGRMTNLMINASEGKFKILINKMEQAGITYDVLHMDAGWYTDVNGANIKTWLQTGTWEINKTKFPTGLASLSEIAREKGNVTGLWFEPEWFRLDVDTFVKNNPEFKKEWLIYHDAALNSAAGAPWYLLNLGNEEAFNWVFDKMCSVIDESGITLLKMDFNADPGPSWRVFDQQEGANRSGITENLYVQAYYRLFESFLAKYPNMVIGSCASGGGRNDLETMRLAVVMNSTDYNADDSEVKQGMNWSLSQWLPYHDSLTRQGGSSKVDVVDLYDARSNYSPSILMAYDLSHKTFNWEELKQVVNEWNGIKQYFYSDYFTLTEWNNNNTDWIGWMYFDSGDQSGFIQMFRPEKSKEDNRMIQLCGLDPEASYTITDPDGFNSVTASGKVLMQEGISYTMPQARYSSLLYIAQTDK